MNKQKQSQREQEIKREINNHIEYLNQMEREKVTTKIEKKMQKEYQLSSIDYKAKLRQQDDQLEKEIDLALKDGPKEYIEME